MRIRKEAIQNLLTRGVEEVIERRHLERALLAGKPLRIKLGVDPTGDKIHIGRAVILWKLREFQNLGHKIVLIIGDFTAQVGDPSDKLEKRPFLAKEEVKKNLENYLPQIGKILDLKKAEVRYNSEWLKKLDFQEISQLAENFTIQQMIRRRNFSERWEKNQDISLREFMYPLMQGYDSVAVRADVELGGTDQLFNLLAGRKIQERYKQKPQDILVTQMLPGLDGRKMSTSWGNVINIADPPDEQYGKVMSMHDDQIVSYFTLATDVSRETIAGYAKDLRAKRVNPKTIKEKLAFEIVKRYHGEKAAEKAGEKFDTLFSKKETSGDLPVLGVNPATSPRLYDVIVNSKVVATKSTARALIEQGSIQVIQNGKSKPPILNPLAGSNFLRDGDVLKIGKRHFFRIKIR